MTARRSRALHALLGATVTIALLAALTALAITAGLAPAHTAPGAQDRVGALFSAAPTCTPGTGTESSCTRPGSAVARPWIAVGCCVATKAGAGAKGAFGGLSRAEDYGVWPYQTLASDLRGTGLQAHHLIEKRFAGVLAQSPRDMASVAVTKAEHQAFTNAWRREIPYGDGTRMATRSQVEAAASRIYANHPEIRRALGLP